MKREHAESIATDRREYAERIFTHYAELAAGGGWKWDRDNEAEIGAAIEAIVEAATLPLVARIEELEGRIGSLARTLDSRTEGLA